MTIIFRYLLAELTRTWLVITGVFAVLTLGLGMAKFIARAAAGDIPVGAVAHLALAALIKNLEIVLPVAVFLAILLVFGRLCRDNEMAAWFACRSGFWRICKPVLVFALATALLAGVVSNLGKPYAERSINTLSQKNAASMIQSLTPGQFHSFRDGRVTFFAGGTAADGSLTHIFIRLGNTPADNRSVPVVIRAKHARQRTDPKTGQVIFVLENGWRYEGRPGAANYRVVHFDEYGIQVRPGHAAPSDSFNTKSTLFLIKSSDPDATADWQIRLSVPLAILILAMIALPLGQVPPRAGRYGRIVIGTILCVVYVNGINLAATGIKAGLVPPWIGVWWVHVVALGLALILLARQQGWFATPEYNR